MKLVIDAMITTTSETIFITCTAVGKQSWYALALSHVECNSIMDHTWVLYWSNSRNWPLSTLHPLETPYAGIESIWFLYMYVSVLSVKKKATSMILFLTYLEMLITELLPTIHTIAYWILQLTYITAQVASVTSLCFDWSSQCRLVFYSLVSFQNSQV